MGGALPFEKNGVVLRGVGARDPEWAGTVKEIGKSIGCGSMATEYKSLKLCSVGNREAGIAYGTGISIGYSKLIHHQSMYILQSSQ